MSTKETSENIKAILTIVFIRCSCLLTIQNFLKQAPSNRDPD